MTDIPARNIVRTFIGAIGPIKSKRACPGLDHSKSFSNARPPAPAASRPVKFIKLNTSVGWFVASGSFLIATCSSARMRERIG